MIMYMNFPVTGKDCRYCFIIRTLALISGIAENCCNTAHSAKAQSPCAAGGPYSTSLLFVSDSACLVLSCVLPSCNGLTTFTSDSQIKLWKS